jgi:hypothetical protein
MNPHAVVWPNSAKHQAGAGRNDPGAVTTLNWDDPITASNPQPKTRAERAFLEFLHLSPFSKGDAALFAAGGLYWFVPHPL